MRSVIPQPDGWRLTTIGGLATHGSDAVVGGPFGSSLTTKDYVPSGVPVIRGSNLSGEECQFIDDNFMYVSDEKAVELSRNTAEPGDVIFTQRGTLGQVAIIPADARFSTYIVSQSQMRVRVDEVAVLPRFLYWQYRGPFAKRYLESRTLATGVPHINLGILKDFPAALPPLPEQRRIVAILDEADALRRKRREALGLLDELLRSAFLEMFGDPVTNPQGWPVMPLRRVISSIEPGWSAKGSDRPAQSGEWGVLKISAVTTGMFRSEENKSVGDPVFSREPVVPRQGDLLFSRANTRELVAATCLVDQDVSGLFLPDKLWRISCDPGHAVVEWLRFLLAHDGFRSTLTKNATGTSGSMLNVSQEKLLDLDAPVPPLDIQRRFARAVWDGSAERIRVSSAAQELDALFESLLHRAFSGEL